MNTITNTDLRHLAGLFSLKEVADRLGISYRRLYYLTFETKQVVLPTTQINGKPRPYYTAFELPTVERQVKAME